MAEAQVSRGGGRTRRRVDVRREEIVGVALTEIEQVGMAAVRVADVAQALGVSTGLVFYHFGTRDELVVEAFRTAAERDLERMRRAARTKRPAVEVVRSILRTYGPTGSATGWRLWVDAWALSLHEPLIAAELRRLDTEYRTALVQVIEVAFDDGSVTCPTSPRHGRAPHRPPRRPVGGSRRPAHGLRKDLRRWVGGRGGPRTGGGMRAAPRTVLSRRREVVTTDSRVSTLHHCATPGGTQEAGAAVVLR